MRTPAFNRYALYGEQGVSLPPEFVHLERIYDRSSVNEWTIEPHAHPHMVQLLLVEEGGMELAGESGRSLLRAPALILVPPSCIHAFRFDPGAEGWVLSLAATLANDPRLAGLLDALPALKGSSKAVPLDGVPAMAARLRWLLADLALRLGQGGQAGPALLAHVAYVLATAGEAASLAEGQGLPDGREPLVARFRTLVEERYRDHWPVTAYASALGTTPSTLTRATRLFAGKAPADMVHDRLLLEAKRNLAFTGATVAQIAYALGFADPAYFARFFKARTGFTASDFRKNRAWTSVEMRDNPPA